MKLMFEFLVGNNDDDRYKLFNECTNNAAMFISKGQVRRSWLSITYCLVWLHTLWGNECYFAGILNLNIICV